MKQRHQVSTLLEDSQLADHFFSMVKGLQGRDALYKNPGISLRSFVVTQCRNRLVDLDDEMQAIHDECISFNKDPEIKKLISDAMRTKPYELVNEITKITGPSKQISQTVRNLNALIQVMDIVEAIDDDQSMNTWVQTLIELQRSIDDLTQVIESFPIKAPR